RNPQQICVVEGIADIWAIERSHSFQGHYHVLGGTVSALTGVGPEDLKIPLLIQRVKQHNATEVILALGASIEGQTTSHIITERLQTIPNPPKITTLAKGMPVGAAVDYMDEGTLTLALQNRQSVA
ncbi:MAG: recombination protein RecR, partial [Proteobacteria bacterium]|nr:recombination protein RecR [Pseudomonadota bacterium]